MTATPETPRSSTGIRWVATVGSGGYKMMPLFVDGEIGSRVMSGLRASTLDSFSKLRRRAKTAENREIEHDMISNTGCVQTFRLFRLRTGTNDVSTAIATGGLAESISLVAAVVRARSMIVSHIQLHLGNVRIIIHCKCNTAIATPGLPSTVLIL